MHDNATLKISGEMPLVSIAAPSLNTGNFLRDTLDSIFRQSYQPLEVIVVDGGSTDDTLDILQQYPQVRWISEKEEGDNGILDAIWKGFEMSSGKYFTYLCISDGFHDRDWIKSCVDVLEQDPEVSAVWSIHQEISEEGHLGRVAWPEYLSGKHTPPQKRDFLAFWFACRQDFEITAIFRREVFEICYPRNTLDEKYRFAPSYALNYNFKTRGYLPFFLPYLGFYARTHKDQRQEKHYDVLDTLVKIYDVEWESYRKDLFSGRIIHRFRDGQSNIIGEMTKAEVQRCRRQYYRYLLKHKLRKYFEKFLDHL